MRKSKNRYFDHSFVSPGDAPGAITLNVVWMEREFHAYKLSRWMCPSNYNPFWDTVRYLWKNRHFIIPPLHSMPPLGGVPVGISSHNSDNVSLFYISFVMEKLEWCHYPKVKKFRRYVYSFWRDPRMWQTDGQTNGQTLHVSIDRACITSCGNKNHIYKKSRKKTLLILFICKGYMQ